MPLLFVLGSLMIDYRLTQLATEALRRRQWPQLATLANQLIAADNTAADPYFLLGLAHWQQGELGAAMGPLQQAIRLAPQRLEYLARWAAYLADVGDLAMAAAAATRAATLSSRSGPDWQQLGEVAVRLGLQPLARDCFAKACAADGKQPRWWHQLGNACQALGERVAAAEAYRRALKLAANDGYHHWALAQLEPYRAGDPHLETLRTLWGDPRLDTRHRGLIGMALAKALDDLDAIHDSFAVVSEARSLLAPFHPYDAPRVAQGCRQLADGYAVHPVTAASIASPLFIVGLPHSGLTLLEQLLSANPEIAAGGALAALPRALGELSGVTSRDPLAPELLARLPAINGVQLRQRYEQLRSHRMRNARYLTDRQPLNGLYSGTILAHWPDARIIHIRRSPLAVCWRNFSRYQSSPLAVGHSLDSAAHYYRHHDALLGYYQQRSPQRVTSVSYEQLLTATDDTLAELQRWLGLAPQPATGVMVTASNSANHWRRYERYLTPIQQHFAHG